MNLTSKSLITIGILLILLGVTFHFGEKFFNLGKLPGDIAVEKNNLRIYFPITSSILLSIAASLIIWIIRWLNQK